MGGQPQSCNRVYPCSSSSHGGSAVPGGAGRFLVGIGDPRGPDVDPHSPGVVGDVGDVYQRLDGGPGETFYVKESGNATVTGWAAK